MFGRLLSLVLAICILLTQFARVSHSHHFNPSYIPHFHLNFGHSHQHQHEAADHHDGDELCELDAEESHDGNAISLMEVVVAPRLIGDVCVKTLSPVCVSESFSIASAQHSRPCLHQLSHPPPPKSSLPLYLQFLTLLI